MLQGGWDFSNTDPFATKLPPGGKPTITGPHVMVVGPAAKSIPGYDRTGEGVNAALPYVMWKDTPYEHLILLCHEFLREFRGKLRAHAGHRGSRAWPIA